MQNYMEVTKIRKIMMIAVGFDHGNHELSREVYGDQGHKIIKTT